MIEYEIQPRGSTIDMGGRADPAAAYDDIRYAIACRGVTSKETLERIAASHHCRIRWIANDESEDAR